MEGIYGSYRHKKISHSTQEVTEKNGLPDWSRTNGVPLRRLLKTRIIR